MASAFIPAAARAGVIGDFFLAFSQSVQAAELTPSEHGNLQTMLLPRPAMNLNPISARGGGDVTIVDSNSLVPAEGPAGTIADMEKPKVSTISRYVVREGDSLNGIAKLFNVKPSTVLWANDLPVGAALQVGQQLTILPVTGLRYTTKKGDTLASIAKKYSASADEIASYNGVDDSTLAAGVDLIVPNGEIESASPVRTPLKKRSSKIGPEPAHNVGPQGSASEMAYYIAPLTDYIETQEIHGYNAVDLAAPTGTPVFASAGGDVIVAKGSGWNGGYGEYVVIQHDNGSQTLYSHMSKVSAYDGQSVAQGEIIGYVGQTGKATGPHVHFEIRNGIKNPF